MPEAFQSWKFPQSNPSAMPDKKLELLPSRGLLTPRRLDVAVKWRYFKHLISGSDAEAERMYQFIILARNGQRMKAGVPTDGWKTTCEHWCDAAKTLLESIHANGFLPQHAIPVDKHFELMNGTHRLACMLALKQEEVWVWRLEDKEAWAPAWDLKWFEDNCFDRAAIQKTLKDFEELRDPN